MSDKHHAALMRNLGGAEAAHTKPGANVAVKIRNSTEDETLQRTDSNAEAAYHRRKVEPDMPERVDGMTHSQGRKAQSSRGSTPGAFDKLRAGLRDHVLKHGGAEHMAKAQPPYSVEEAFAELRSVPVSNTAAAAKPVRKALAKVATGLGNTKLAKSLQAGYGSDVSTLTGGSAIRKQSLSRRLASATVGEDPKPAPPTADEILKAASRALYAGAISGQDAQAIQGHVNMTGACPEHLLKKLRGEVDQPKAGRLLTKATVRAACQKGMTNGVISGAEGIAVDMALSMDRPVDEYVMRKLNVIHAAK
ncbi:hypothetical protein PQR14_22150 [Paraburkholderia bryophila]|uniref:hypothetical protein n=1 Tax=Paraburkholderia bryophila TaxID=420952 RepID=UPI0038B84DF2